MSPDRRLPDPRSFAGKRLGAVEPSGSRGRSRRTAAGILAGATVHRLRLPESSRLARTDILHLSPLGANVLEACHAAQTIPRRYQAPRPDRHINHRRPAWESTRAQEPRCRAMENSLDQPGKTENRPCRFRRLNAMVGIIPTIACPSSFRRGIQ